jgi:hypothetical protein
VIEDPRHTLIYNISASRIVRRALPRLAFLRHRIIRPLHLGSGRIILAWPRSWPILRRGPCSRQGHPAVLAELLLAAHKAAQYQLRSLSGTLRPEAVRRSVKGAGLGLANGRAKWVVIVQVWGLSIDRRQMAWQWRQGRPLGAV